MMGLGGGPNFSLIAPVKQCLKSRNGSLYTSLSTLTCRVRRVDGVLLHVVADVSRIRARLPGGGHKIERLALMRRGLG